VGFVTTETRGEIRTPDGITLATAAWVPDAPKAIVLLAHGHAEHLGRYGHVIAALNGAGYAVHGTDHRGHGRSTGERALAVRFDDFVDDFRLMAVRAEAAHPGLPVVVLGHSMGGLIAARYTLAYQAGLAALVTSGAAFIVDEGTSAIAKLAARLIARVYPKAPVPRDDSDTLSYDPAVKVAFKADPLTYHGKTRMQTATEMVAAGADALERAPDLCIPLLAMHGADDTLTSPNGTERFYERARSPNKTLKLWPHMKHEIFNEFDKASVITYMVEWLESRVPASSST
jgi:alpha-beta hydrolase superfamily lysophospholipase